MFARPALVTQPAGRHYTLACSGSVHAATTSRRRSARAARWRRCPAAISRERPISEVVCAALAPVTRVDGKQDTIIVPAMSTLKLASRFDEPGHWLFHCHILEHAEGGMMGE